MVFQVVKGRSLERGQRVEVYFNLHKKLYSIRDKVTGLVVAHADSVLLVDAIFKVSQAGRQRVLREQKKNVHAFVEGLFAGVGADLPEPDRLDKAYYNPYKTETFIDKGSGRALKGASLVHCRDKQAYYVNGVFA